MAKKEINPVVETVPTPLGIKVVKEPFDGPAVEPCALCWTPTKYWYEPKDVAVCPTCSQVATYEKVPDKEIWLDKVDRFLKKRDRW